MYKYERIFEMARLHLNELEKNIGEPLDFSQIEEKSFGYVFFYQSVDFIKTNSFSSRLVGNSPFIINSRTGEIYTLGTAHPVDFYLEEYEKNKLGQA